VRPEGALLEGLIFDPAHLREVGSNETELEDARKGIVFAFAESHLPRDAIPRENVTKLESKPASANLWRRARNPKQESPALSLSG
jgi:hypothetical protein